MKKIIGLILVIAFIALIAMILINNKSNREAKAKTTEFVSSFVVNAVTVAVENVDEKLSVMGTMYPYSEVSLLSETQGRVVELKVDVGSHVAKGSLIAKVDDELKQAAYDNALARFEKAKWDLEKYEALKSKESANESQLVTARLAYKTAEGDLKVAKRQLEDTKIISPASGIITSKNIEIGSVLSNNTQIMNIVDISTLRLRVNLAEKDAFKLREGLTVEVRSDVYPEEVFNGKIRTINAKADEAHTYQVEVLISNSARNPLRAGMFARAIFNGVKKNEALVIPREALVGSIREAQIYVVENSIARLRKIEIGSDLGDRLEVTSGIRAGERVITNGQINLKDSVEVKVVNQ